ncbi:hypothetical protein, conserved [Entamoeba dispar SAW760]|uniref:Thioredoxin domain-containing protein n=1 Tax=Entamoeba dispar (strain ATCC PRA-260 / SAW760) TaxID=370354 RepID=B0EDY2_ENTDS|nr:uncharacterized protein EDI_344670 [Entamoeba dispar SAW760]EDR27261.1 hypothetical protein, conserved [Entamoeba dispar SAW760]|eukprot:EDR27261.1 hypothetical protein, conserved [Entamoeba dispar SAW760]
MTIILLLLILQISNGLYNLNYTNFEEALKQNQYIFIKFTITKNCPFCIDYTREFNQLSMFMDIPFGSVICEDKDIELCEKQNITVLPTSILYKDGKQYRSLYGMYEYGNIKQWIKNMLEPTYIEVKNEEEIKTYRADNMVLITSYFPNKKDEQDYHSMLEYISNDVKRFKQQFIYIINDKYKKPTIVINSITSEDDEYSLEFELERNQTRLEFKLLLGFIPPFSSLNNIQNLLEQIETPILHYIYDTKMSKSTLMKELAKKYQLKLPFVTERAQESKVLAGHSQQIYPCISISFGLQIYSMNETIEITKENVENFIENFFSGKLQPAKKHRTSNPQLLSHQPPIITSDIYDEYIKEDAAIVICPFSFIKCQEYINSVMKGIYQAFENTPIKFGVIDIEEDDIISEEQIVSYPTIILTTKDVNKTHIIMKPITSFDPIEIINEINIHCQFKLTLSDKEVIQLRKNIEQIVTVIRANEIVENENENENIQNQEINNQNDLISKEKKKEEL